jgi:hypothetical protein
VGTEVKQKLDETGVTEQVKTLAGAAAEKTVETGAKLYHSGAEKFEEFQ